MTLLETKTAPGGGASKRRKLLVAGIGLAVAATAAVVAVRELGDEGAEQSDGPELTTVAVEQRALAEYLEIAGTLNYAQSVTLTAQSSGVLLDLAAEGAVVRRGGRLYQTVNEPTTAETADALARLASARSSLVDAQEQLSDASAGPTESDIAAARAAVTEAREARDRLVEPPSAAEVASAEAAVATASESLNTLLDPGEATLAEARSQLSAARSDLADLLAGVSRAEVDSARAAVLAAESDLAELLADPSQAEIDAAEAELLVAEEALAEVLAGRSAEEMEALRASVASAEAAVVVAEADLAALDDSYASSVVMYGRTPVYRTMALGSEGEDVRQLEQNLAELGYVDTEGFGVDGVFDAATAVAVRAWQEATGRHADETVRASDIVFVPGPVQMGSWAQGVEPGQEVVAGTPLAALTVIEAPSDGEMVTTQQVTASLLLSDRDLVSEGISVNVELPDGTDIGGTVAAINPSPVQDAATGDNAVEVTILLAEPASDVWIGATVDVEITETLIEDALVVPATALLALAEGGYAVEVLAEDGSVALIGVQTGLFVDGDVEVVSGQLATGMRVVVPR